MKQFFLIIALALSFNSYAQDADKTVVITVSGSGKMLEDAKQAALRSAIEQAFGAFISSKTEMLNDQVVADQMASVSSGNIKSFSILNESQFPDGSWGVTLKALISLDKLTSFVEAKGIAIEIKGGMFAINIKQQILNEQNEIQVISNTIGVLHETMQKSFDYSINAGNPLSIQGDANKWEIPISIIAKTNKNINFSANYLIKVIDGIKLNTNEIENYKSLNRQVFPIAITFKGVKNIYYLRNKYSIMEIESFASNWEFYVRNYKISNELEEIQRLGIGELQKFIIYKEGRNNYGDKYQDDPTIIFPDSGQVICNFKLKDKKTLSQIEKITGYKVNSIGISSNYKFGGIVVEELNGHGFVCALSDIDIKIIHENGIGWRDINGQVLDIVGSKKACKDLMLNGYTDWKLPSSNELLKISNNLYKNQIGNFSLEHRYHHSGDRNSESGWGWNRIDFEYLGMDSSDRSHRIRAIRYF